jgi:hypothetical protein
MFDVADPTHPVLLYTFDTSVKSGEGIFEGAWGCYPFTPDNHVYINDRPNGLYVFRVDPTPTGVDAAPARPPLLDLHAASPNPFGASTSIRYTLGRDAEVTAEVYDAAGRLVRRLGGGFEAAGAHEVAWDGTGDDGARRASGVYFCRIRAGGVERTGRLVLIH